MILGERGKDFSEAFLKKHHELVLVSIAHHIQTFLLYPSIHEYSDPREKVILTLSVNFYNKQRPNLLKFIEDKKEDPSILTAIAHLLGIPDETYLRETYSHAMSLGFIEESLKEKAKDFKRIANMVWALLRQAETNNTYHGQPASFNKAIERILGDSPLKQQNDALESYLGGEKAYESSYKLYKSVVHFIAALGWLKIDPLSLGQKNPRKIEEFLKVAHWFRKNLLKITNPHQKRKELFLEDELIDLPAWIDSEDILIPIQPFEDEIQKMKAELQRAMASR